MENLRNLLSTLNAESSVETIRDTFSKIAEILLFKSYIKTSKGNYRILEIEFYFKNKNHEDNVTINRPENEKEGTWWLHNYGVDLSFKSESKQFYGGILIRSIVPYNIETNAYDEEAIYGPQNSCWMIFYSSALENNMAPQIIMNNDGNRHPGELGTTKRYITGKTKRIDGDYRFYVKGLDLKIKSTYKKASPWENDITK